MIEKFYVAEDDTEKKGQALLKMSTSVLKAEVEKQRFATKIAESQVRIQKEKIKKVKKLFLTKVLEYKKYKNLLLGRQWILYMAEEIGEGQIWLV